MILHRRAAERGQTRLDWLDSRHSFSFADYWDPRFMGFGALRVINDDFIAPGGGFPTHGHRDMEILTWVVEGAVEHKDSLGSGGVIRAGEAQRMTAGSGIRHSEFNPSCRDSLRLLQIWLEPNARNLPPSYEQRNFAESLQRNNWALLASPDSEDGALALNQDARIFAARFQAQDRLLHNLLRGRRAWVQLVRGKIQLSDIILEEGDGLGVSEIDTLDAIALENGEALLFDLA